ncbi:hypothetical protein GCM10023310_14670 [Paenibacillus vulneris]|uniref:Uncharacterized protein n=1 Tax=Paenibacillus vulneris TaxID=1133364 RepID=A0ABW3UI14_9BACL|nr:hypothetical protein [Paenibacillus sp. 32352]
MLVTGWLAFYAAVLFLGIRSMLKQGSARELFLYAGLIGWCAYLTLSKLFDWPQLSVIAPVQILFLPVGKWIEHVMGGPTT